MCMYIRNTHKKVHGIQERNHVNHSILAPSWKHPNRMNNSFVHKTNNPIIITINSNRNGHSLKLRATQNNSLYWWTCAYASRKYKKKTTRTRTKIKCLINDFAYFTLDFYRMNKRQTDRSSQLSTTDGRSHKNEEINGKITHYVEHTTDDK